jgi:hypothetical protein
VLDYLSTLYWHDVRYYISVPLCLGVGYLIGWNRRDEKCERDKSPGRYRRAEESGEKAKLEDLWDEG